MKTNKLLQKKYKIIIFDWDGTAIMSRDEDATEIINTTQSLLNNGIILVIVTGTTFDNINDQFSKNILKNKHNLYICSNRGSEVFNFDINNNKTKLFDKKLTKKENNLLDEIVISTKALIEGTSCAHIQIIFDRKNRRKIDLLPEWKKPKKNEFKELLIKVEENLALSGFAGGLGKAYSLLDQQAKGYQLNNAKITSDIKHLEIGITDKRDSINWIYENVIKEKMIQDNQILIAGDEFGKIGGFDGSDYKMVIPNKENITYFSVGIEPSGTPNPIINLGGGPKKFNEILKNLL